MSNFKKKRDAWQADVAQKVWSDPAFKKALFANPKAVIAKELGVELPKDMNVHVLEENLTDTYLIIPRNPQNSALSDEQLEAVAGGYTTTVECGPASGTPSHSEYRVGLLRNLVENRMRPWSGFGQVATILTAEPIRVVTALDPEHARSSKEFV